MRLPPEIHGMLFDLLDELDSICLLLTCKYFTRVGARVNTGQHWVVLGQDLIRVNRGFTDRIPRRLRLCQRCGIMRPKDTTYWDPHCSGWDWRKLITMAQHEDFGNSVNEWATGQTDKCPRCYGKFVAQGNIGIGDVPSYGHSPPRSDIKLWPV